MIHFKHLLMLGALALASCTSQAADKYNVVYPASAEENGLQAYIIDYDNGAKLDSAIIADGRAYFTGEATQPRLARLIVDGRRAGVFILQKGDITVDSGLRIARGTRLNDEFTRYVVKTDSIEKAYERCAADSAGLAERQALLARYESLNDETLKANADNPIGYYIFLQQAYEMDAPALQAALAQYPAMAGYKRIQDLQTSLQKAAATAAGNKYADFEVTYGDNVYRLSDYVGQDGQYLLVDFWASWCGPCIKEIKTVKRLYEKWGNGRGLNVLSVAVWDEPENTERAIAAHKLPWPQIINAQKIPTDLYGISGIPHIMLIAPDGTILFRGLQGQELEAAVNAALESAQAQEEKADQE